MWMQLLWMLSLVPSDRNCATSQFDPLGAQESVMGALALGGQQLMGQTVMVKSSEAEKNLAWEAAQVTHPSKKHD